MHHQYIIQLYNRWILSCNYLTRIKQSPNMNWAIDLAEIEWSCIWRLIKTIIMEESNLRQLICLILGPITETVMERSKGVSFHLLYVVKIVWGPPRVIKVIRLSRRLIKLEILLNFLLIAVNSRTSRSDVSPHFVFMTVISRIYTS